VKIYVAGVETLRKKEREDETQFITKFVGKNSLDRSYFGFVKFSFPVTSLLPCYAETGRSNYKTFRIALKPLHTKKEGGRGGHLRPTRGF
jgi:hypothetical protein